MKTLHSIRSDNLSDYEIAAIWSHVKPYQVATRRRTVYRVQKSDGATTYHTIQFSRRGFNYCSRSHIKTWKDAGAPKDILDRIIIGKL